jgi:hypothetical protein
MRGSDQGKSSKKRQCLTCKNKGCIGHCRFAQSTGVSDEAATQPRLYRSPVEPVHWVIWTGDGWFRFPAKLDGWSERCAATDVSRQKLQRVPLRMAFNTGLIESFQLQVANRAA